MNAMIESLTGAQLPDDARARESAIEARLVEIYDRVSPYSPTGIAAYFEAVNSHTGAADRVLRRTRSAEARATGIPMRIVVILRNDNPRGGVARDEDEVEVYGWRAALAAARAFRAEVSSDPFPERYRVIFTDARFERACDRAWTAGMI